MTESDRKRLLFQVDRKLYYARRAERAENALAELLSALEQSADASEGADDAAAMLRYGKAEAEARATLAAASDLGAAIDAVRAKQ